MHEVMRFWLGRGVDGFRVDVIWHLIKDDQFRDNPPNPDFRAGDPPHRRQLPLYSADRPEVHEVIRELRGVVDEFPERLLIGEIYLPLDRLVTYYGRDLAGVHLPFNFSLLETPWNARAIAAAHRPLRGAAAGRRLAQLGAGQSRPPARRQPHRASAGARGRDAAADAARHAHALLRRRDRPAAGRRSRRSASAIRSRRTCPALASAATAAARRCNGTPAPLPGFRPSRPGCRWPRISPRSNVARQRADPASLFNLYRRLIALRRVRPALSQEPIGRSRPTATFWPTSARQAGDRLLVALNFGAGPAALAIAVSPGTVLLSSDGGSRRRRVWRGSLALRGHEGVDCRAWHRSGRARRPRIGQKPRFSGPFALTCANPADTYATLYGRR